MSNPNSAQKRNEASKSDESITQTGKQSSQAYIPKRERIADPTQAELGYNPKLQINSRSFSTQFQSRALGRNCR